MNTSESGNVQQTIDSKPSGPSRWANPRVYNCTHEDCDEQAKYVSIEGSAHNCCGIWHHEEGAVQ